MNIKKHWMGGTAQWPTGNIFENINVSECIQFLCFIKLLCVLEIPCKNEAKLSFSTESIGI